MIRFSDGKEFACGSLGCGANTEVRGDQAFFVNETSNCATRLSEGSVRVGSTTIYYSSTFEDGRMWRCIKLSEKQAVELLIPIAGPGYSTTASYRGKIRSLAIALVSATRLH